VGTVVVSPRLVDVEQIYAEGSVKGLVHGARDFGVGIVQFPSREGLGVGLGDFGLAIFDWGVVRIPLWGGVRGAFMKVLMPA
jgi:hypothetical protein